MFIFLSTSAKTLEHDFSLYDTSFFFIASFKILIYKRKRATLNLCTTSVNRKFNAGDIRAIIRNKKYSGFCNFIRLAGTT
jgi:hypothetical protein